MEAPKKQETTAPGKFTSDCADDHFWRLYKNQEKWAGRLGLEKAIEDQRLEVDSKPWKIYLEPSPRCNLNCCDWSENRERAIRPNLTSEMLESYLAELWSSLIQVKLYYWGEPFINDHLPEIISRIHDHEVGTCVQSNFQSMTPELAEQTVRSGLDVLVAIMDGATQRTYGTLRKGGDLATAISNLGTFMKIRRKLRSETPRVVWQFTAHQFNEFEARKAQRLAEKLGLDGFVLAHSPMEFADGQSKGRVVPFERSSPSVCHQTWSEPVILSDGRLMPSNNPAFGKFEARKVTDGFYQAFNSESFIQARQACKEHPFTQVSAPRPCNR